MEPWHKRALYSGGVSFLGVHEHLSFLGVREHIPRIGKYKKSTFSKQWVSRMSSSSTQPWPEDTQSAVAILDRILQRLEVLENIQNLLHDLISIHQGDPIDIDNGPWQETADWDDDEREATQPLSEGWH